MSDLVAMTFNIRTDHGLDGRNSWWFRRRSTVAAIRDVMPDLAGLQEARPLQVRYLAARLPEYEFVGAGRGKGRRRGEHCPVLVRRERFAVDEWDVRSFSRGKWGRIATIVRLAERGSSAPLGVVCTHFDHRSEPARRRSAAAVALWIREKPGPWIVLGDLNATAVAPSVQTMLSAGLHDALAHLGPRGPGLATAHAWRGGADGPRIDHILISAGLEVVEARIVRDRPGGRLPSDHWPVVARLRRTPARARP
jgi:endonuclease/exonuclease/phosphatase family metal-dependent hydrolase